MEQEDFISQILNTANGITKVVPDDSLFFKIEKRINVKKTVPIRFVWIAAASIVALLFINVYLLQNRTEKSDSINELFQSIDKSDQIY